MTPDSVDISIIQAIGLVSAGGADHTLRRRTRCLQDKLDRALRLPDDDRV